MCGGGVMGGGGLQTSLILSSLSMTSLRLSLKEKKMYNFFFKDVDILIYVYGCFVCLSMHYAHVVAIEAKREHWMPLELELQMAVS